MTARQRRYLEAARRLREDDDTEIDERPKVSESDAGAWVRAWVWIPKSEIDQ